MPNTGWPMYRKQIGHRDNLPSVYKILAENFQIISNTQQGDLELTSLPLSFGISVKVRYLKVTIT